MLKRIKCLVCRALFKLGLIKACKAPPLPGVVIHISDKKPKAAAKKPRKTKKSDS